MYDNTLVASEGSPQDQDETNAGCVTHCFTPLHNIHGDAPMNHIQLADGVSRTLENASAPIICRRCSPGHLTKVRCRRNSLNTCPPGVHGPSSLCGLGTIELYCIL